jgi:PiT family inorganic phosphate transporter
MNQINQEAQQNASFFNANKIFRPGFSLLFILTILFYVNTMIAQVSGHGFLTVAAIIGGYMALNIGANDVANNVGPSVGSKALTMTGAIIIAIIFESAGALLAGGDVVSTIKKDIIDPALINDTDTFIWLMMAALLAGAIWLNIATVLNAPVSTTHSIVGGVLGAGIAARGFDIVNWTVFGKIAASWVISPVLGGLIAASFLYLIKRSITYQENMVAAAKIMVPILISLMACVFSTYLILKGLKNIWTVDILTAGSIGGILSIFTYFIVRPVIAKVATKMENSKSSVNDLFTIPLIFSAALLSFAHGANDVANAVGPLAAINDALFSGEVAKKAAIPLWVMLIGALGISIGLALYGTKLIRTVGSEITELDKVRAFCIALSASITVIFASQLGLPISSTHTAVGAIFGVGFLREFLKNGNAKRLELIKQYVADKGLKKEVVILNEFKKASMARKKQILKDLKVETKLPKKKRKSLKKIYRHELVKRNHLYKIAAAWIITVPASGILAAFFYFTIRGMLLTS